MEERGGIPGHEDFSTRSLPFVHGPSTDVPSTYVPSVYVSGAYAPSAYASTLSMCHLPMCLPKEQKILIFMYFSIVAPISRGHRAHFSV